MKNNEKHPKQCEIDDETKCRKNTWLQVHPIIQNYTKPRPLHPAISSDFLQKSFMSQKLGDFTLPGTTKKAPTDHTFWYATLHRYATSALPLAPHSRAAAHQQTLLPKRLGSREISHQVNFIINSDYLVNFLETE